MVRTFMVIYRPYKGKEEALLPAVKSSYATLREKGFVTSKPPHLMRAADNSIIIVFEWSHDKAQEAAQADMDIQEPWKALSKLCIFEKPVNLSEFQQVFPEFEAIPLDE
jgi:hypothetical protein